MTQPEQIQTGPLLTITMDTVVDTRYDEDDDPIRVTILDQVVESIVTRYSRSDLLTDVKRQVAKRISEEIDGQVAAIVAEALTAPIQKTTSYGEPVGEPTTLKTLIGAEVADFMKPKRDSFGSKNTFATLLHDEVDRALATDLKATIVEARKQVVAKVQGKAAELIADSVRGAL